MRPDAPASCAIDASARTTSRSTSVANGGSFTNTGFAERERIPVTRSRRCASLSRSRPHETLGQLAFSSTPSASGSNRANASSASSTASSAMLTNRTAAERSPRASDAAARSAPGLGRPIAFVIEALAGYRTIRGFGFPWRDTRVIVPPTT